MDGWLKPAFRLTALWQRLLGGGAGTGTVSLQQGRSGSTRAKNRRLPVELEVSEVSSDTSVTVSRYCSVEFGGSVLPDRRNIGLKLKRISARSCPHECVW